MSNSDVYPLHKLALKKVAAIERGGNTAPWQVLINAENLYALQYLQGKCTGQISAIFIDPPYNTGDTDWTYNNCFGTGWTSFMSRRLRLAKPLLNPRKSVLICTIDERECPQLWILLQKVFPKARIQMVTSVISRAGDSRRTGFTRKCEYIFFVMIGSAAPARKAIDFATGQPTGLKTYWYTLTRHGSHSLRTDRPHLYYPIFFSASDSRFAGCGTPLPPTASREAASVPAGCFAVWPTPDKQGRERVWSLSPQEFKNRLEHGFVQFGPWAKGRQARVIKYLTSSTIKDIRAGRIRVLGRDKNGAVILQPSRTLVAPPDIFDMPSYDATKYGTNLLRDIIGDRFTYPKSLYAVRDYLGLFVGNNPHALVLDFFAGSGTTGQAVNLLNKEDGGQRRCILVTNNEVSRATAKKLKAQGLHPGDPEWKKHGIAYAVTWPRMICTIKGTDIQGRPLKGKYHGTDIPMADGFKANAIFYDLIGY